ncbi:MAG: DUF362 domain-containing protein [Candidatus Brocadiales bacterium]
MRRKGVPEAALYKRHVEEGNGPLDCERTRREFLRETLGVGLAYSLSPFLSKSVYANTLWGADAPAVSRPKVILSRSNKFLSGGGKANSELLRKAVDDGVMRVTGAPTAAGAWSALFKQKEMIGIKLNCLGKKPFSPHVELVEAIIDGLKSAGIKDDHVIVFDRTNRELEEAGFRIRKGAGVKSFGTDALAGGGYDLRPQIAGSVGSCFSRIISSFCDAIINVPILKDHDLSGVSAAMKNFYGVIHNPNKYHDNNCDPYIAELNTHPYIRDKSRLIICDALVAQYNGGPAFKRRWSWPFGGILMATDPVALDRTSANIIEEKRKEMGFPSLKQVKREPKYIRTAAALGLGEEDPEKIELVET